MKPSDENENSSTILESGIKENINKHFQNKKKLPVNPNKKNMFIKITLITFVIGGLLFSIALLFYIFMVKGSSEKNEEETKKENNRETEENSNNIYEDQDTDNDGLTTVQEMEYGTKSDEIDTDFDGIPDGWEVVYNLNPLYYNDALEDDDEDKLTNVEEYKYETNPQNSDTDNDGFVDGTEVSSGYDPKGPGKLQSED